MPFGLSNAPTIFQSIPADILGDRLNQFVFVFFNDTLILPKSKQKHVEHTQVVHKLQENQLFDKVIKSES